MSTLSGNGIQNQSKASLTGTLLKQSDCARGEIPDLSQKAEEQKSEEVNCDTDITAEENIIK